MYYTKVTVLRVSLFYCTALSQFSCLALNCEGRIDSNKHYCLYDAEIYWPCEPPFYAFIIEYCISKLKFILRHTNILPHDAVVNIE